MKVPPKEALYRIDIVDGAWSNLRPNKTLGGMTLDQYRATTKASYDVRAEIAATEAKLQALIATRASVDAVSVAAALYVIRMFAITGIYHRYFSHRTFKTTRWFQFLAALLGNTCVQRGPLWWAAHHRHHHRYSDHELDIHSWSEYRW